jgi:hypothetical protein
MGPVTANIQPIEFDEARTVPSASGRQAIAVIEADGFGRHKPPGNQSRYPACGSRSSSPVAIKPAVHFHAEATEQVAG